MSEKAIRNDELLSVLYKFQQEGQFCDAVLVSTEGLHLLAHAAMLAAASPPLKQKLAKCPPGIYTIKTSLSTKQLQGLVRYAYGQTTMLDHTQEWQLDSLLLKGNSTTEDFQKMVLSSLFDFSEKGQFCDMTITSPEGESHPVHSYLFAARLRFSIVSLLPKHGLLSLKLTRSVINDCAFHKCLYLVKTTPSDTGDDNGNITDQRLDKPINTESTGKKRAAGKRLFQCFDCDKDYLFKHHLIEHQRIHNGEMLSRCLWCDKRFTSPHRCKTHVRTHTGDRPYVCKQCGKAFSRSDNLKSHQRTHTGEKPYKCSICDKRFSEHSSLKTHLDIHTGKMKHVCSTCGKGFAQAFYLKLHQYTHTNQHAYHCAHCNRGFNRIDNLHRHERIHTGEREFECDQCGKKLCEKRALVNHMMVHTGEKPYKCDHCDTNFHSKSSLKKHMKMQHKETGEKPYKCDLCNTNVPSKSSLKKHMKMTHMKTGSCREKSAFICDGCHKEYKTKWSLKRHKCDRLSQNFEKKRPEQIFVIDKCKRPAIRQQKNKTGTVSARSDLDIKDHAPRSEWRVNIYDVLKYPTHLQKRLHPDYSLLERFLAVNGQ